MRKGKGLYEDRYGDMKRNNDGYRKLGENQVW